MSLVSPVLVKDVVEIVLPGTAVHALQPVPPVACRYWYSYPATLDSEVPRHFRVTLLSSAVAVSPNGARVGGYIGSMGSELRQPHSRSPCLYRVICVLLSVIYVST